MDDLSVKSSSHLGLHSLHSFQQGKGYDQSAFVF